MLIKILLSYILGYLNIKVEGYFAERFINMCLQRNILLWKTKKLNSSTFLTKISIRDFKKIKLIVRKTKCRVNIKNKKGLPFLLERYKKRKILAILLMFFFIVILVMSNYIWNIDIECDEGINKNEIYTILENSGLKIGKLKKEIDTKKIINSIRYERNDISWVGISFKGTNAIVKIIQAQKKPDIIKSDEYCNIVSNKEGIITKINVQNGLPTVKVGDLVKSGTILVNGWLEGKYTGIRYVHAVADIEARVWYCRKERINKKQEVENRTGKEDKKYSIKINNFEINLYKTLSNFENYDTIIENKKLKIFSNFYLPIEIDIKHVYEKEKLQVVYSIQEIKNIYIPKIEQELEKQIESKEQIINKQMNINEQEDYVDIEIIYEVIENIGTEEKIVF